MYTYKDVGIVWVTAFVLAGVIILTGGMPGVLAFAQEAEAPPAYAEAAYYAEASYYAEAAYEPAPEPTPEVQAQTQETINPNENTGSEGTDGQPDAAPPQDGENGDDSTPTDPATDGEPGQDNNAPVDPPAADGTPTTINTGDASADSTSTDAGNLTNIDTPAPDPNTYPYGKPPAWFIAACEKYPQPKCEKYIVKPPPTTVVVSDDIVLENGGEAVAETGENTAVDPEGVSITTGNSDAFGYLISLFNVVVTNSTGSILFLKNPLSSALDFTQRIMDIFNNLAGGDGDCTLLGCSISDAVFNLITDDTATVSNELIVRAGTGANAATSTDGVASIDTGNANAFGGIVNFGNLQIVDSRYMIILMTNQGDLSGNIVLPEAEFFRQLSTGAKFGSASSFDTTNGADVTNDGTANADTGDNAAVASSTEEIAQIHTGEADADASTINFVNQIGAPICFIVNVGGRWRGDVKRLPEGFSREQTEFGEIICGAGTNTDRPGARDNFHATTTNYAKVLNKAIVEATTGANAAAGAAARINTGDADAFVQILNVLNQSIIGQDWIFALFTVTGDWNGNLIFGADPAVPGSGGGDVLTQIAASMLAGAGGGLPGGYTSDPKLSVTKTANVTSAKAPAKVDYTVVVKNDKGGGAAYRAVLSDILVEPSKGSRISTRWWNLGTVKEGEEITLTYTIEYNEEIPYGVYENTATVSGYKNSSIYVAPNPFDQISATASVEISGGEILGVQTTNSCKPLLKGFVKVGQKNSPEDVRNLQTFLLVSEGDQIGASGVYDQKTINAVKKFQQKYAEYILTPWGVTEPTGNVYYTTQHTINNMYCRGSGAFSLSADQVSEINGFKAKYTNPLPNVPKPDPIIEGVGQIQKKMKPPVTLELPKIVPASALLKSFAPTSNAGRSNGLGKWMKSMMPFVEAGEE
ncbi:MAG: hypothetical protein G01um10148_567 [Parcubacteria group bacterium Gr01-1014_8]|nr:MAG: hypothetical protein G01um10148_567 [Parcubacteria group bacterium Gr01-1014_8]